MVSVFFKVYITPCSLPEDFLLASRFFWSSLHIVQCPPRDILSRKMKRLKNCLPADTIPESNFLLL